MRRALGRCLAVVSGWAIGYQVSFYTHLLPGYGYSHGDDPVALIVWVTSAALLWSMSDAVLRERG